LCILRKASSLCVYKFQNGPGDEEEDSSGPSNQWVKSVYVCPTQWIFYSNWNNKIGRERRVVMGEEKKKISFYHRACELLIL